MTMKKASPILLLVAISVAIAISLLRPGRGEIYWFRDGFIAVDDSRTPPEYYVSLMHSKEDIKKIRIVEEGLDVTYYPIRDEAEMKLSESKETYGPVEVEIEQRLISWGATYERPPAGSVELIDHKRDFIDSRTVTMDPAPLREIIENERWNASLREIMRK